MEYFIPLLLALVLCFVHYFSEDFCRKCSHHKAWMMSFGAGVAITYVFLQLFPEFYHGVKGQTRLLFIYLLLGFTMFHLVEKYYHQHKNHDRKMMNDLRKANYIIFFFYHFIVGVVLFEITSINFIKGILFFIPLAIMSPASTASLNAIYGSFKGKGLLKVFLSLSPLFGGIFAYFFILPNDVFFASLALVGGALTYVVVRDVMPSGSKGNMTFFISGVVAYTLILLFSWIM